LVGNAVKHAPHALRVGDAPPLSELTGIRLGGKPVAEIVLRDKTGAEHLPELVAELGGLPAVIGKGSNIIAADEDLPLVLIRLETRGKVSFERHGDEIWATAPAGLPLPALLNAAAAAGLGGLEGLAGIPGSVGGAVAMNAGSFGTEIGSLLRSLTVFSPRTGLRELRADAGRISGFTTGDRELRTDVEPTPDRVNYDLSSKRELRTDAEPTAENPAAFLSGEIRRDAEQAEFSYRRARCLGLPFGSPAPAPGEFPVLLLEARFALSESGGGTVRRSMRAFLAEKRLRQPVSAASAGCVFKNPAPDAPAGRLLEEAGMKGRVLGGMRFSSLHAGFLVNEGGGSCAAALELIDTAVEAVRRHSGFTLEKEVCLWVRY
jgi:UDP-N-acetylenolpyruvoylglucosamine reductase